MRSCCADGARRAGTDLGGHALPDDFAGAFIETVDLELVLGEIAAAVQVAHERILENGLRVTRYRGGDEDTVSPDDGTGVPQAGNGSAPRHVAMGVDVPGDRGAAGGVEHAGRAGAAERRPVLRVGRGERKNQSGEGFHKLRCSIRANLIIRRTSELAISLSFHDQKFSACCFRWRPCCRYSQRFTQSRRRECRCPRRIAPCSKQALRNSVRGSSACAGTRSRPTCPFSKRPSVSRSNTTNSSRPTRSSAERR